MAQQQAINGDAHEKTLANIAEDGRISQAEKEELRGLNRRFAVYISKVGFLEAENNSLKDQLEELQRRKGGDLQPIKDQVHGEMEQLRNQADKAVKDKDGLQIRCEELQKQLDAMRHKKATYKTQAAEYRKKYDGKMEEVGNYEGQFHTLRLQTQAAQEETEKIKLECGRLEATINALRKEVEVDKTKRKEAEDDVAALKDENLFLQELLDRIELQKEDFSSLKKFDPLVYWNKNMKKSLAEINGAYEDKIKLVEASFDDKLRREVERLKRADQGSQVERLKTELKKLRGQMEQMNKASIEKSANFAWMEKEMEELRTQLDDNEEEMEKERANYNREMADMRYELDAVRASVISLADEKLNLQLEIATYERLLKKEEERVALQKVVGQALNVHDSDGVQKLADAIHDAAQKDAQKA